MKYQVEMLIDGRTVRKVKHDGKTYLPIESHKDFQIIIYNNSNVRACAIVSVDGLSVMDGTSASHDDSGYIIEAWDSVVISGWRRGLNEVAKFKIGDKNKSYASKKGKVQNVGVIGVVVCPEYKQQTIHDYYTAKQKKPTYWIPPQPYPKPIPMWTGIQSNINDTLPCASCNAYNTLQSAGTEYGDKVEDNVSLVSFKKDTSNKEVIVLYYDDIQALRAKGVPVDRHVEQPNPFPAQDDRFYCPEPY